MLTLVKKMKKNRNRSNKILKFRLHPTIKEIEKGLLLWQKKFPERIVVENRAITAEGRPLLFVRITDIMTTDENKQVVL